MRIRSNRIFTAMWDSVQGFAPNLRFDYRLIRSDSVSCPLPRVLMIDDQPDVRTMVSIVLRVNHFEVVEAANAAAGLKEFEAGKFDLAIVDIFLQGTNGFDIIMKMRERIPDFPIVAISGMTMLDFVNDIARTRPMSSVSQKPFRPADLVLAVEVAMRPRSSSTGDVKVAEIAP